MEEGEGEEEVDLRPRCRRRSGEDGRKLIFLKKKKRIFLNLLLIQLKCYKEKETGYFFGGFLGCLIALFVPFIDIPFFFFFRPALDNEIDNPKTVNRNKVTAADHFCDG